MTNNTSVKKTALLTNLLQFILLTIAGLLIILLCKALQHTAVPAADEYYYSNILRNNFTILAIILFVVTGFAMGYFLRYNAWFTGFGLILIFPLTAITEAAVYRGSHNLIPFEMVIFFVYALPAIAAAYIGKLIAQKIKKSAGQ
jgi:hypothetical protein